MWFRYVDLQQIYDSVCRWNGKVPGYSLSDVAVQAGLRAQLVRARRGRGRGAREAHERHARRAHARQRGYAARDARQRHQEGGCLLLETTKGMLDIFSVEGATHQHHKGK